MASPEIEREIRERLERMRKINPPPQKDTAEYYLKTDHTFRKRARDLNVSHEFILKADFGKAKSHPDTYLKRPTGLDKYKFDL